MYPQHPSPGRTVELLHSFRQPQWWESNWKTSLYINHLLPVWPRLRGSRLLSQPLPPTHPTSSSSQHNSLKFPQQWTHQTQRRLQRCDCNGIYVNGRVKLASKLLVSPWKSLVPDGSNCHSFIRCDVRRRGGGNRKKGGMEGEEI